MPCSHGCPECCTRLSALRAHRNARERTRRAKRRAPTPVSSRAAALQIAWSRTEPTGLPPTDPA